MNIYKVLAKVPNRGPRAGITLARALAGVKDFKLCNKILATIFTHEEKAIAEELRGALVYWKLGMRAEAVRALAKIVADHEDSPSTCLMLGDWFAAAGFQAGRDHTRPARSAPGTAKIRETTPCAATATAGVKDPLLTAAGVCNLGPAR